MISVITDKEGDPFERAAVLSGFISVGNVENVFDVKESRSECVYVRGRVMRDREA